MKINCETKPELMKLKENVTKQLSFQKEYWSKTIFNEFIEIMADEVRLKIGQEIAEAGMYFLVIDECKDRASHEQLSLCVQYSVGAVAKERYVGLVRLAQDFSAEEAIANKILPFIPALNS